MPNIFSNFPPYFPPFFELPKMGGEEGGKINQEPGTEVRNE
jgi:hypothetical protein